jgi:hypothetical protein
MIRFSFFICLICILIQVPAKAQINHDSCIYTAEDQKIAEKKLKEFSAYSRWPLPDLIVKIGLSFADTPYVGATLENGPDEKMVINLRQLDCTTFVENVLALARTIQSKKKDFKSFATQLQNIRYRDGLRIGYPSRLHYFSDWIDNNRKKGLIDDSVNKNGVRFEKSVNYMSTHSESYPVLKSNPELIPSISNTEKLLNQKVFWYFPKSDVANLYKNLKNGDIIGLTSNIDGIDINHVGFIVAKENEFYLLHASLGAKKVLLATDPITDFLKPTSKNSGIMIARPGF